MIDTQLLTQLRQLLVNRFSDGELRTLYFDLGWNTTICRVRARRTRPASWWISWIGMIGWPISCAWESAAAGRALAGVERHSRITAAHAADPRPGGK